MHGSVVDARRDSSGFGAIGINRRVSLSFLFIANVICPAGLASLT